MAKAMKLSFDEFAGFEMDEIDPEDYENPKEYSAKLATYKYLKDRIAIVEYDPEAGKTLKIPVRSRREREGSLGLPLDYMKIGFLEGTDTMYLVFGDSPADLKLLDFLY